MRKLLCFAAMALVVAGCDMQRSAPKSTSTNMNSSTDGTATSDVATKVDASNPTGSDTSKRDNTAVNTRDRSDNVKTPIDQNENRADVDTTADIRRRVVDTKISVNAQNVKIITQGGKVTLRGPVASQEEKDRIEKLATEVAGEGHVDNQIEIQP